MKLTILALAALFELQQTPPEMIKPYGTFEECAAEAIKRNQTDEDLRTPEAQEKGKAFVCLRLALPV